MLELSTLDMTTPFSLTPAQGFPSEVQVVLHSANVFYNSHSMKIENNHENCPDGNNVLRLCMPSDLERVLKLFELLDSHLPVPIIPHSAKQFSRVLMA